METQQLKFIRITDYGTGSDALLMADNRIIVIDSGGCPVEKLLAGIEFSSATLEADIWNRWVDGYDGDPEENNLHISITDYDSIDDLCQALEFCDAPLMAERIRAMLPEYVTICSLGDDRERDHLVLWQGTADVEERADPGYGPRVWRSPIQCDIALIEDGDHEDMVYRHPETGAWIETTPGDNHLDDIGYSESSVETSLSDDQSIFETFGFYC